MKTNEIDQRKPRILCIVGRSGSGKTTLEQVLCGDLFFQRIVSFTTRNKRESEVQGREHFFVVGNDFTRDGDVLACTEYGGYRYWAYTSQLSPVGINTYVIDAEGLRDLKQRAHGRFTIRTVYVRRDDLSGIDPERLKRDEGREQLSILDADMVILNDQDLEYFTSNIRFKYKEPILAMFGISADYEGYHAMTE